MFILQAQLQSKALSAQAVGIFGAGRNINFLEHLKQQQQQQQQVYYTLIFWNT